MAKNMYLVGGGKGGVGKSFVTRGLVDYLRHLRILLVDSDTTNPMAGPYYEDDLNKEVGVFQVEYSNLDGEEGWKDLINLISGLDEDVVVVVDAPARGERGMDSYFDRLSLVLPRLDRKLVTLWVINNDKESLFLLEDYLDKTANASDNHIIHVVKNKKESVDDSFTEYEGSRVSKEVKKRGGKAIEFPYLMVSVRDLLNKDNLSFEKAIQPQVLNLGDRIEVELLRSNIKKVLENIIYE